MQRAARLRDRRRGGLDPDRRGAHAADHLRARRGEHRAVPADQRAGAAPRRARRKRTARATISVDEKTKQVHITEDGPRARRAADAGGGPAARGREPLRRGQHPPDASPQRGAARARALQARRRVHRARRRGDHRR